MLSPLSDFWREVSADLGIKVTTPFSLITASGKRLQFDALVHEFGSRLGMLLMERWDAAKAGAAAEMGYGYSCLSAGIYDRETVIEILQDWGWSRPSPAPEWLVPQVDETNPQDR
jgi:hypothetical protein